MAEAFEMGGLWMWIITVFGLVFYALAVFQLVKAREHDITPVLLGLLAAVAMTGPLGTCIGLNQAGVAIEGTVQANFAASALAKGMGVAFITTAYSLLIAVPGAILLGIAANRARRFAQERLARA